jgi:hypothetical protein
MRDLTALYLKQRSTGRRSERGTMGGGTRTR